MSLRTRLSASAILGAAITLAALVAAFNLVLDARLRAEGDNVLRERAATVLRGLGTVDGRLSVIEALDKRAIDAQTWIFAGTHTLEQPAGADPRNHAAALGLAGKGRGFATVQATHTRLEAVPVGQGARPLGTVVVGASLAPYESTASSALLGSVILAVVMLAAIAALSGWLIKRALRPVAQMTAQVADWGERDLSRRFFAGEPHDELTSLASVFDGLLSRLAEGLRREQGLTAEVSHELRTPLAKVLAEAELASARYRSPQEYRASLQAITRHARDLQRVLETLLASARASVPTRSHASDARASAEGAAAHLGETLAAQGKEIQLLCARSMRVAVDGEVVERILSPLLENAARFARHRIELEIRGVDGEVVFEVRDDGPGVDPYDRERIFDPGYRGVDASADRHLGAGLGLPLV
ncbi:MAG: ATP-binding protein, partial [Actinomycetota bacterium]|nr:ATP-binding protein [Actinomycetota bacterium]